MKTYATIYMTVFMCIYKDIWKALYIDFFFLYRKKKIEKDMFTSVNSGLLFRNGIIGNFHFLFFTSSCLDFVSTYYFYN